ncbi:hypothetical protein [Roseibium sp. Sym1]|uniref:hypothetical protein n=1 Tax=Roseibium sp. Sym1 TaxID=3016006 RepID=UPI0022B2B7D2|nr:hypothetical protein [Roseibium sp. Sym1]
MSLFFNRSQMTGAYIIDNGEDEVAEVFPDSVGHDEAKRLAALFAASETMHSALIAVAEWCDLIEQNYPEMAFTKHVRAAMGAANGESPEPVKNYAVTGRAYGDDEASTRIYNGYTWSVAIAKFNGDLAPDEIDDTTKFLEGEDFEGVYIDSVIESDSPLQIK